jgi:hypothetical protein
MKGCVSDIYTECGSLVEGVSLPVARAGVVCTFFATMEFNFTLLHR